MTCDLPAPVSGNGEALTSNQWQVLSAVHTLGLATTTELAQSLHADRSNVNRTLTGLLARHLVHRPEAGDSRWQVTELGLSVLGLTPAAWAPPTGSPTPSPLEVQQ